MEFGGRPATRRRSIHKSSRGIESANTGSLMELNLEIFQEKYSNVAKGTKGERSIRTTEANKC